MLFGFLKKQRFSRNHESRRKVFSLLSRIGRLSADGQGYLSKKKNDRKSSTMDSPALAPARRPPDSPMSSRQDLPLLKRKNGSQNGNICCCCCSSSGSMRDYRDFATAFQLEQIEQIRKLTPIHVDRDCEGRNHYWFFILAIYVFRGYCFIKASVGQSVSRGPVSRPG